MIIQDYDICQPLAVGNGPLEIEVGCGKGRFLTARAAANPTVTFIGIERMLGRVQAFAEKARQMGVSNAHVLRLEALYVFWYMLPTHGVRRVFVFFPDPWPKKRHHSHRLFGPLFLQALWKRLELGGRIEFATDHAEYFKVVETCFAGGETDDGTVYKPFTHLFRRVEPMKRGPEEWTEFETKFRSRGMPIYSAAWESIPSTEYELKPMQVAPEDEPRAGLKRRIGKEWQVPEAEVLI